MVPQSFLSRRSLCRINAVPDVPGLDEVCKTLDGTEGAGAGRPERVLESETAPAYQRIRAEVSKTLGQGLEAGHGRSEGGKKLQNPPRFREGNTTLIPYVAYPFPIAAGVLPLVDVILGPGSHPSAPGGIRLSYIGGHHGPTPRIEGPLPADVAREEGAGKVPLLDSI